jgi:hypothetical protein
MNLDLLQQKYPLYQTLQTMPFKVLADQGIITNQNVSMQNFDKSGGSGGATAKG